MGFLLKKEQELSRVFSDLQVNTSDMVRRIFKYVVLVNYENKLLIQNSKNEFKEIYKKYNLLEENQGTIAFKNEFDKTYLQITNDIDEIISLTDFIYQELSLLNEDVAFILTTTQKKMSQLEINDPNYASQIRIYSEIEKMVNNIVSAIERYLVKSEPKYYEKIYDSERNIKALLDAYLQTPQADKAWAKNFDNISKIKEKGFDIIKAKDKRYNLILNLDENDKKLQYLLRNKIHDLVEQKNKELHEKISQVFLALLFIFIFLFFLILIVGAYIYYVTNKIIIRPITLLTKSVQDITNTGDYSKMISYKGTTDLTALSDAFNKMIHAILDREFKIKEERNLLEVILSGVDNGIAYVKENKFIWINNSFTNILGWTERDFLNKDITTLNFIKIKEIYLFAKEDIERNGVCRFEYSVLSNKGKNIPCFLTLSPIEKKKLSKGYILSIVDISKLREKEALLESSINNMTNAFLLFKVLDDGTTIELINCNKKAAEMFNVQEQNILGKDIFEVMPGIKENGLFDKFINVWKHGEPQLIQNFNYIINGNEILLEISIYKVMDGFSCIIRDVTKIVVMQRNLLHYDKLATVGQIAAGVAHEIGNPLTSINSIVQFLKKEETDATKIKDLELVSNNIERIIKIIRQIVDYSTLPKDSLEKVQVNSVIKNVLDMIKYHKKFKNIKIKTELLENIPEILIDAKKLEQVILNIFINAADAILMAEKTDGLINIFTLVNNNMIYINIKDNGTGIEKELLDKILDPFFTTKKSGHGSGLGLTISYNIVKSFNGSIEIESEKNVGTTIKICFKI